MALLKELRDKVWSDGCDVAKNTLDAILDSVLRYLELDTFIHAELIRVRGDMDAKFSIGDGECKAAVLVTDSDENIINLNHLKDTGVVVIGIRDAEKRKDRDKGNGEHPGQMRIDDIQEDTGAADDDVPFSDAESEIVDTLYEPCEDETPVGPKKSKLAGKRKMKRR